MLAAVLGIVVELVCEDLDDDGDGTTDENDDCVLEFGNSTQDLVGCLDTDGDGWISLQEFTAWIRSGMEKDQADLDRLATSLREQAFDVIVDDGSHAPADVRGLFMQLFPLLKPGGIYAVEDLNSAWDKRGVVPERREVPLASGENGTHVDMLRDMIKTLNRVNFDPSYSAGVNGIDHLVGSIFCTEEACALRSAEQSSSPRSIRYDRILRGPRCDLLRLLLAQPRCSRGCHGCHCDCCWALA